MAQKPDWKDYYTVGELRAMLEGKFDGMPVLMKKPTPKDNLKFDAIHGAEIETVKLYSEDANTVIDCPCLVINLGV